jgi:predicted transcriptional regulator
MRSPALSEDLVPVDELGVGVAGWLRHLQDTGRPLVLTQRGRAAAVVVRPEMLDELEEERAVVHMVLRGLREVAEGEVVDDAAVWKDVEAVIQRAEKKKRARPVE